MFSFFMRNWRKIEVAIKVVAFVLTVVIEAVKTVAAYAERETQTATS